MNSCFVDKQVSLVVRVTYGQAMPGVLQGPEPFKIIFGLRSVFTRDCFRFIGLR